MPLLENRWTLRWTFLTGVLAFLLGNLNCQEVFSQEEGAVGGEIQVGVDQSPEMASSAYVIKRNKLIALRREIGMLRERLRKAILKKNQMKDPSKKKVLLGEMMDAKSELDLKIVRHNQALNIIKYKFPEKDKMGKRDYVPLRVKTFDEIENEIDIDGHLTRVRKKVDKKYESFLPPKERETMRLNTERREIQKIRKDEKDKKAQIHLVK